MCHDAPKLGTESNGYPLQRTFLFLLIESRIPAREWCHLQWEGLSISINTTKTKFHMQVPEPISRVVIDSHKLTINIKQYNLHHGMVGCEKKKKAVPFQ